MKKNIMVKNLTQSVRRSLGRYIAILAIIALGAGMFVGLNATKYDMVATGQKFMDEQNMFDLRLISSVGWGTEQLEQIAGLDGLVDAEGVFTLDAIGCFDGSDVEHVYKLYSIPQKVSKVHLLGGRMPENSQECLADGFGTNDSVLGKTVTIAQTNTQETLDSLTVHTFTVVGYVSTPLYMDMSRGNTTLGNGSVFSYLYLPEDAFDLDYYGELQVTIPGDHVIYSEAYNDAMEKSAEALEPLLQPIAQERLEQLKAEAEVEYADGLAQYEDAMAQYRDGRFETYKELNKAKQQLHDGEQEIADGWQDIEDGLLELDNGQKEIDNNLITLSESRQMLAQTKMSTYQQLANANSELLENYKTVSSSLIQVNNGLLQINNGLTQLDSGITQLESGLSQIEMMIQLYDTMIPIMNASITTAEDALSRAEQMGSDPQTIAALRGELDSLKASRDNYVTQRDQMFASQGEYSAQLEQLRVQREEIVAQKAELEATKATLDDAMNQIDTGMMELQNAQTQADNQFAAAEAQIDAGQAQLDAAQRQLDSGRKELEEGKLSLLEAEEELASGWKEFYAGQEEAFNKINEAKAELADARKQLKDAREAIDAMVEADVFILDRNTNVGYLSLDSNSDIVEGVSAVFPAFFLLIAALVCITTMTRMVEEERTQIGTLKALGYSNAAIIGKYLAYAGSAAIVGCGLGVLVGSVVFPLILWKVYGIMMLLTPELVLRIDWKLCMMVVGMYTAVTLFVTWYCCRMALREVPAELIRPKPPTSGKKILLEYLPFWNKFSFLNKVMLRNIFRYRQRLLMMLVGIGGCAALLLTGFGVRDSIVDIVSYQFQEITLFDIEVRFSEEMTQEDQLNFRDELKGSYDDVCFFHQSSVELDFGDMTQDITLMVSDAHLKNFMDFHKGEQPLAMPGAGEALLSIGSAEKLGIQVGDTVYVRNADMQTLELTVSGVFDNHVYNYIITTPETVHQQWGSTPKVQMACVSVNDTQDVHETGARITEFDGVMTVTVNKDIANQVGTMLEALDLVVATIVVCAGLLAVIVLYNLTNINITERIREIATIKVLGFRAGESAAYVFKENLLLSAMGAFLGQFGGIALLEFVMSKIRIDMVWFEARLRPMSFVLAVVLTMLSACFVDFLLYFKLEKINMAEALKSVE